MALSLYQRLIVPYLLHLSMGQERLEPYRRGVVRAATGRVLEVGVGSGINFRFYENDARQIVGIDPSPKPTLCSIPDVQRALREMRRVLRPSGKLLFVEHGEAPESNVARWQHRLDPLWTHLAGGCHLDRPIDRLISEAGFTIDRLGTGYMEGPKLLTFLYEGAARPR